ncbi:MAG: serpin family protein [Halanaeroarchaeum sp.]
MNRRDVLARSGALAMLALAGCQAPASDRTTTDEPTTTTPDDGTTTQSPVDDERLAELAAGNANFALDLHRNLAEAEGGNQFLSPYSISVALAMTYAGARGETATQMRETLRYTLGQDIHPAFEDLQAALERRETAVDPVEGDEVQAFELAIANALWGREGYPFAEDYLSLLEEHYGGGLRQADFAGDPEGARARINDWVADRTEDRIENLLPSGSITPATVLVLTNAIYFMAGWQFQFDPEETTPGTFTALDRSTATVPMMQQTLQTNYADLDGAKAIELPYVGREVSMVLVLPDQGTSETFERKLTGDRLFEIFDALGDANGELRMPRYEYEFEVQLSDALSALGMPIAFGSGADFGGMVEGDGAALWIDEVFHRAFVSVDEEGTEAAAATGVVMDESAAQESFDLTIDRPFLFCIRDRPTNAVLFLGRVVDAGAAQG